MPRNVRVVTRSRKRPTKWCASSALSIVPNQGGLAVGDGIPLCPGTAADADVQDPLIGWCRGHLSLSRVGIGEVNPCVAWAIVMMRTDPGTTTPLQVFNPFNVPDLERQDILSMGHIAVPPMTSAAAANRGSLVSEVNCRVGRKFHRNANMLFLWIVAAGAADNDFECTSTIRSLMKFG